LIAGVVAAALLVPVPAFGLTFLGNWTIFQQQVGSLPPVVNSGFNSNGGFLNVSIGAYAGLASSKVVASNAFWVNKPDELVTVTQDFLFKMRNANVNVIVQIIPLSGGTNFFINPANFSAGNFLGTYHYSNSVTNPTLGGLYLVNVKISTS